jgi:flagellar protein FliO/FliZ
MPEPTVATPMAAPINAPVAGPVAAASSNDEDKTANTTEAAPLSESEIPVFTSNKENKKAAVTGTSARMFISILVIAVLGGGLFFFSKWYGRNNRKDIDNNRIRVLNQHFLGPRKSLAIIRVAGETILIGVTDQNISMIKALSLLDDEVPTNVPQNFSQTLAKADQAVSIREEDKEDFIVSNIKDKISLKLKDLRPL